MSQLKTQIFSYSFVFLISQIGGRRVHFVFFRKPIPTFLMNEVISTSIRSLTNRLNTVKKHDFRQSG